MTHMLHAEKLAAWRLTEVLAVLLGVVPHGLFHVLGKHEERLDLLELVHDLLFLPASRTKGNLYLSFLIPSKKVRNL